MIINRLSIFGVLLLAGIFFSCSKDNDDPVKPSTPVVDSTNLILTFNATTDGQPMEAMKEFTDPLGRKMKVELFKHYISNVYLINGTTEVAVWPYDLLTYVDGTTSTSKKDRSSWLKAVEGTYTGIRFSIGLNPEQNKLLPNQFPHDHPLGTDQNTSWEPWGYRFMLLEGKADIDGDGVFSDIFNYHTGIDTCYRTVSFEKSFTIKNGSYTQLEFAFDINDIFFGPDTVDFAVEKAWHGELPLVDIGLRLSNNFAAAIKIK